MAKNASLQLATASLLILIALTLVFFLPLFLMGLFALPNISDIKSPTFVTGKVVDLQDCSEFTCKGKIAYQYHNNRYTSVSVEGSDFYKKGKSITVLIDKNAPEICAPLSPFVIIFCVIIPLLDFATIFFLILFIVISTKRQPSNNQPKLPRHLYTPHMK